MALTLQECIDAIKKEYPEHFPYAYIEIEGKYVFNLIEKGQDPEEAISDMHVVDPNTGYITGGISIMEFLKDPGFREAWKKPNLVANHDESIGHSVLPNGWKVRRNYNGSPHRPFGEKTGVYSEDNLTYGGSLMHYGIKGQKWGVRRYQYDNGSYTPEGKERYGRGTVDGRSGMSPEAVTILSKIGLQIASDIAFNEIANRVVKPLLQKRYNNNNQKISEKLIGDIAELGETYSAEHMPPEIKGEHSVEDDMAACNPRYKNGVVHGTSVNCTLCALTYDLRRRGYDVMALCCKNGTYPEVISKSLYVKPKRDTIRAFSFNKIWEKAAKKYPEGARGEISVSGSYMGHSMAWEIRNGKLEVIDSQRNVRSSPEELTKFGFNPLSVKFTRTDNLQLKPEGISLVSAAYKPEAKKILDAERKQQEAKAKAKKEAKASKTKQLSDAQRRKNYEQQYLKEHPNADKNAAGLKNWVDAQMGK